MKKIIDIANIPVTDIVKYTSQGWKLYGQPQIASGTSGFNVVPSIMVVKYGHEEIGENIVDSIYLSDYSSHNITTGEKIYPDVCKKAREYIKLGYQPCGQIMSSCSDFGFSAENLVMAKYE